MLKYVRVLILSCMIFSTDSNSSCSFTNIAMVTFLILALMFVDDVASMFLVGAVLQAEILG